MVSVHSSKTLSKTFEFYCCEKTKTKQKHDYGNSYKGKHLIGAGLQFQKFSPLSSWQDMAVYKQTWY